METSHSKEEVSKFSSLAAAALLEIFLFYLSVTSLLAEVFLGGYPQPPAQANSGFISVSQSASSGHFTQLDSQAVSCA